MPEKSNSRTRSQEHNRQLRLDMVGQTYGQLKVIGYLPTKGKNMLCTCSCGKPVKVHARELQQVENICCELCRFKREEGKKYGNLTVLQYIEGTTVPRRFKCRCNCGVEAVVAQSVLRRGSLHKCQCKEDQKPAAGHLETPGLTPIYANGQLAKPLAHNFNNLAGWRFGRLYVTQLFKHSAPPTRNILWKCQCDCGNEVWIKSGLLTFSITRSCGCLHKEQLSKMVSLDLANQRFGRLLVTRRLPSGPSGVEWECLCDCGNTCKAPGRYLPKRPNASCGCWEREIISEAKSLKLTGRIFGRLLVLKQEPTEDYRTKWTCLCTCGTTKIITGHQLTQGTVSCGCYRVDQLREATQIDMTNATVGRWKVLHRDEDRLGYWVCRCQCGTVRSVSLSGLRGGDSRSCSCLQKDTMRARVDFNPDKIRMNTTVNQLIQHGHLIIR